MTEPHGIVVVGGGLGGLPTVESLRRLGHRGPITLIGDERLAPYDRPPLSKQLLDRDRLREATADAQAVFHFAAQVAVTTSMLDPRDDFEVNILGTLNVLEALRERGGQVPLIFASTNKVYGDLADLDFALDGDAYVPTDAAIRAHAAPDRGGLPAGPVVPQRHQPGMTGLQRRQRMGRALRAHLTRRGRSAVARAGRQPRARRVPHPHRGDRGPDPEPLRPRRRSAPTRARGS